MDKVKFIILVRHGQRMDHLPAEYPQYAGHVDAPLTPLGHRQAEEAAQFIQEFISNLNGQLTISASPYHRCMQTASIICKQLGINECQLNYRLIEHMGTSQYKANPFASLTSQTQQLPTINDTKFIDSEDFKQHASQLYPESNEQGCQRIKEALEHYMQLCNAQSAQTTIEIITTHGFIVDFAADQPREKTCGYCAITVLKLCEGQVTRIINANDDHITVKR